MVGVSTVQSVFTPEAYNSAVNEQQVNLDKVINGEMDAMDISSPFRNILQSIRKLLIFTSLRDLSIKRKRIDAESLNQKRNSSMQKRNDFQARFLNLLRIFEVCLRTMIQNIFMLYLWIQKQIRS